MNLKKMTNKKGFTLAELLIVVAIIAVLVAIAIPVFSSQLEKSREATDIANIRSAYAEVVAAGLDDSLHSHSATVPLKQQQTSWQTKDSTTKIAGVALNDVLTTSSGTVAKGTSVKVIFHPTSGKVSAWVQIGNKSTAKAATGYTVD